MINDQILQDMGFELSYHLEHDDFDGRKGMSHWHVKVSRNGRSIESKYSMGCAHRHYRGGGKIELPYGNMTHFRLERNKKSFPDAPNLTDVMFCLVMEALSVDYCSCFEDWAAENGYDEDSRKAEKIYRACQDTFFALRQLCDLNEMYELFQDY